MSMSPTIGQLAEALAAAQLEFEPIKKDSDNPYFNSKYADLASIIRGTQPALAKNGLVVMQSPIVQVENQKAGVLTMLAHKSGEWMSDELILPATMLGKDKTIKFDAQSVGSAITYARRFSYQSIIGVAAEVDDDGNAAVGSGTKEAAQAVATSKLRSKDGVEILTITPYMQGFAALSGTGLSIVRANMDDSMRAKFGWVQKGNVFMIPVEKVTAMVEFCTFHSVSVLNEVPAVAVQPERKPKTNGHAPATPPVSVDDFKKKFSSVPFADDASTDPIILSAKMTTSKTGKATMWIKWNGHEISTFDKDLFPYLEEYLNKPAMLEFKENGKYKNLVKVVRLGGKYFKPMDNPESDWISGIESTEPY